MSAFVKDIMSNEVITIDAYEGLCKAERIMDENNVDCLPVIKNGTLIGTLTSKCLRKAHPNRIAADAMSREIFSVSPDTSIWKAKQVLEDNKTEQLLVVDEGKPMGVLTAIRLYTEIGKHLDLLTGLYRRDYIYNMGVELLGKGSDVSIAFIDIDKFGKIDKDFGHAIGDVVLKEIGIILKNHASTDTYLCRYGGDEFALLTPYELDPCKMFAETMLKAIANHRFPNKIRVTASVGIAGGRRKDAREYDLEETISNLINLASLASTKAKKDMVKLVVAEGFCHVEATCSSA